MYLLIHRFSQNEEILMPELCFWWWEQ